MENLSACLIIVLPSYHVLLAAFVYFPRGALRIQTSGHQISRSITRPTFPAADVVLSLWFGGVLDRACRIAGTLLASSKCIEIFLLPHWAETSGIHVTYVYKTVSYQHVRHPSAQSQTEVQADQEIARPPNDDRGS